MLFYSNLEAHARFCACGQRGESYRGGRARSRRQTAHHLARRSTASAQTPGTSQSAHAPGTSDRSLPQRSCPGETELFAEARNAHAVTNLSGSRLAHRLRERRKCQQGSRRSPPQGSRHAASVGRTSIPCSCYAMRSAIGSGTRRGGHHWLIGKSCAHAVGTKTESLG